MGHRIAYKFVLAMSSAFSLLSFGCGGPDASIDHMHQSEDGKTVAFLTHLDNTVHVATANLHVICGSPPFAISRSGKTIVTRSSPDKCSLRVWRIEGDKFSSADVPMTNCIPCDQLCHVNALRCDDQVICLTLLCGSGEGKESQRRWFEVHLASLKCESRDRAAWDLLPAPIWVARKSSADAEVYISEFRTRSGMVLIEKTPRRAPASVSNVDQNRPPRELVRESLGRYWARQLTNTGFRYPS